MATDGLNFVDGANKTLDWSVVDENPVNPYVSVTPVIPILAAQGALGFDSIAIGTNSKTWVFTGVAYDTDNMIDPGGAHPERLTINTAGLWLFVANGEGDTAAATVMTRLNIRVHDTSAGTDADYLQSAHADPKVGPAWSMSVIRPCDVGDYVMLGLTRLPNTILYFAGGFEMDAFRLSPLP